MQIKTLYSKKRLWVLFSCISIVALYVIISYGKLAFTPVNTIAPKQEKAERGSILDKTGKPLAVQTTFYHLVVTPSGLGKGKETTATALSSVLNMTKEEILTAINSAPSDFLYLKKKLDQNQYEDILKVIKDNKLTGLRFDEIPGRIYPEHSLASQVIGFMGDDGKGLSGIEFSKQNTLAAPEYTVGTATQTTPNKGKNIYLTLDANLQYKLEKIAQNAMDDTQAESIMMVVTESKTGEILSYISLPAADLNTYSTATQPEKVDRPAVLAYEPGSVFKIFSVASFIDAGVIKETERFYCDGKHEIISSTGEKAVITCLDHHGWVTAREALQYSCNDALAQMSDKIKADAFLNYIGQFGFGSRTGIELPSETRGSVKTTSDKLWSLRSKPTISIGQEISVSALQMVEATTTIANGGTPVKLSLISKVVDYDGNVEYEHETEYGNRVVSKKTADYLLSCMETTARAGTGSRAGLSDVSIGVKTGTAQMLDPTTGKYSTKDFVSNCVAIFPIEDPTIILYIVITKAQGETYAGRIVAPVIAKAADVIIDHLGMARANAASLVHSGSISFYTGSPIEVTTTVPDFTGTPKRHLTNLLQRDDLTVIIQGDGYVISQYPPAGTPTTENMTIELFLQ